MSQGGARTGAGRPEGSRNRRTEEVLAQAEANGMTPLAYMLEVLANENSDPADRKWAAEKSAPYLHPRPTSIDRVVEIKLPEATDIDGIGKALDAVLKAVSSGKISPSEGQTVANLLEGRRKLFETSEMADKLAQIERLIENKGDRR